MPELDAAVAAITKLSPADRHLIADAIGDTGHMVDDDMGDDADARRSAYHALAAFVRQVQPAAVGG